MKIFVGIDIAKLNHFAAAISSDGDAYGYRRILHRFVKNRLYGSRRKQTWSAYG